MAKHVATQSDRLAFPPALSSTTGDDPGALGHRQKTVRSPWPLTPWSPNSISSTFPLNGAGPVGWNHFVVSKLQVIRCKSEQRQREDRTRLMVLDRHEEF